MIAKPAFSTLKSNYRTLPTQIHACNMSFPNACAIRMSEALVRSNAAFSKVFTDLMPALNISRLSLGFPY